ncbi:unnamed protein product, partial [Hymenolepis diminuta]
RLIVVDRPRSLRFRREPSFKLAFFALNKPLLKITSRFEEGPHRRRDGRLLVFSSYRGSDWNSG